MSAEAVSINHSILSSTPSITTTTTTTSTTANVGTFQENKHDKIVRVDLADYDNRRDEIVDQLLRAAKNDGFFYVVNHGIPREDIRAMFGASVDFFALPDQVKEKYPMDVARNAGWQQIRPAAESAQFSHYGIDDLWPTNEDCPGFRPVTESFMHQCHELTEKLLVCLAIGLGFPCDFFTRCHDISQPDTLNTLRCLHTRTGENACWSANDVDTLTLLFQRPGEPGLQLICDEHNDPLCLPPPSNNEIVCSLGDLIMRWSDDLFKSVRTPPKLDAGQGPRYAIAYSSQANKSAIVQGRHLYTDPITAGELFLKAMERNFKASKRQQAAVV
ncbi:hypothetical protein O0I10_008783 [Lichtheimia ornata]|uniref:Non-haem dioxygenase N-terminal domain-containing protein n=1 Tax=Lichtheimia ornata TaxID=688661 RepID=A0AAD7UXW1_9FUNG|nr:uncharacterized protein O0I10_008783 [Lichtheimia ornata]KAJ8655497.1 hypothetical protein O0I10_008783 [Lichtheimia ornata]